jgi:hypothetical protein
MSKGTKQIRMGKVERDVVKPLEMRLEILLEMERDLTADGDISKAWRTGAIEQIEYALTLIRELEK